MKTDILIADPAGNITAFVLGRVPTEKRKEIAAVLLEKKELGVEQVGFCSESEIADGRLEMAGGEFCGNASRAFAMLLCMEKKRDAAELSLEVSGCERTIKARVNARESFAEAEMPLPVYVGERSVEGKSCTLVHLGGIAHLVVTDTKADIAFFEKAERVFDEFPTLEAYGVMFLDEKERKLIPIVKVKKINSLFWEGSCASGTVACAVARSAGRENGIFTEVYSQPSGELTATVTLKDGAAANVSIGGSIRLGKHFQLEI